MVLRSGVADRLARARRAHVPENGDVIVASVVGSLKEQAKEDRRVAGELAAEFWRRYRHRFGESPTAEQAEVAAGVRRPRGASARRMGAGHDRTAAESRKAFARAEGTAVLAQTIESRHARTVAQRAKAVA